jgi:hypothetical protein
MFSNSAVSQSLFKRLSFLSLLLTLFATAHAQLVISPAGNGVLSCSNLKLTGSGTKAEYFTWILNSNQGKGTFFDAAGNMLGDTVRSVSEVFLNGEGTFVVKLRVGDTTDTETYMLKGASNVSLSTANLTNGLSYQYDGLPFCNNPANDLLVLPYLTNRDNINLVFGEAKMATYSNGTSSYTTYADQYLLVLPSSSWLPTSGTRVGTTNSYLIDANADGSPVTVGVYMPLNAAGTLKYRLVACKGGDKPINYFNVSPFYDSLVIQRTRYFLPAPTIDWR